MYFKERKLQYFQLTRLVLTKYVGTFYVWGPPHCGKLTTIFNILEENKQIYTQIDAKSNYEKNNLFLSLYQSLRIPTTPTTTTTAATTNNDTSNIQIDDSFESFDLLEQFQANKSIKNKERLQITPHSCPSITELVNHLVNKVRLTMKSRNKVILTDDAEEEEEVVEDYINDNGEENYKVENDDIIYIIIDNADCLEISLLQSFLKIQEFSNHKICSILVSELPIEKIIPIQMILGTRSPLSIHFPQYTQSELTSILSVNLNNYNNNNIIKSIHSNDNNNREKIIEIYNRLIDITLDSFYHQVRDLAHLTHIITLLYPKYIEPIEHGIDCNDNVELYNNIQPSIISIINNIYKHTQNDVVEANQLALTRDISMKELGFSFHTKCLLIAGYLASTFSKTKDKLLYTKEKVKKDSIKEKKTGPKIFEVQRLIAILFAIFPQLNTTRYHSILYSQIASLVSLRLFDESGSLESIRLRCNVPYQNIKLVCFSINFDIDAYLNSAEFTN